MGSSRPNCRIRPRVLAGTVALHPVTGFADGDWRDLERSSDNPGPWAKDDKFVLWRGLVVGLAPQVTVTGRGSGNGFKSFGDRYLTPCAVFLEIF